MSSPATGAANATDPARPLARAQYLEVRTLMSAYLLSSQGDRMLMANSVEGRFPFLDKNVMQFCNALPARYKLRVLDEKHLLKRAASGLIPDPILKRPKQPYRAPDAQAFVFGDAPAYVGELLSESALARAGIFNPQAAARLYEKCLAQAKKSDAQFSNADNMALVGTLSTQLLWHHFLRPEAQSWGFDVACKTVVDRA
jgi:asparagine synthase (glutamine-hydrolysing)